MTEYNDIRFEIESYVEETKEWRPFMDVYDTLEEAEENFKNLMKSHPNQILRIVKYTTIKQAERYSH